jgi:hypothetical protein
MATHTHPVLSAFVVLTLGACSSKPQQSPLESDGDGGESVGPFTPYAPPDANAPSDSPGKGSGGVGPDGGLGGGGMGSMGTGTTGVGDVTATISWRTEGTLRLLDLPFIPMAMAPDGRAVAGAPMLASFVGELWTAGPPSTIVDISALRVISLASDHTTAIGNLHCGGDKPGAGRWTVATCIEALGTLISSDEWSVATSASVYGDVVVGTSGSGQVATCTNLIGMGVTDARGFWTPGGTMVPVGPLPGDRLSQGLAVSADGSTALGVSFLRRGAVRAFSQAIDVHLAPRAHDEEVSVNGGAE